MDPPFEGLTAQIEGLWRHMLEDLRLYPIDRVWLLQLHLHITSTQFLTAMLSATLILYTESFKPLIDLVLLNRHTA